MERRIRFGPSAARESFNWIQWLMPNTANVLISTSPECGAHLTPTTERHIDATRLTPSLISTSMPITAPQKAAIEQVLQALISATPPGPRGKRLLAGMFMELVDRQDWPQYYEVIPEPRCLNNIRAGVTKGRYRESLDVYTDLCLVFWNAIFYNEAQSQIAIDAESLKVRISFVICTYVLPLPRSFSPPPSSPQKVHRPAEAAQPSTSAAAPAPAPVKLAPAKPLAKTPAKTKAPAAVRTSTPILMLSQGFNHKPAAPATGAGSSSTHTVPALAVAQSSADAEMDVDIDGASDGDDVESDAPKRRRNREKDVEGESEWRDSEGIVRQLENGLPKWPGYGDDGWMAQGVPADRFSELVHIIKSYKDVIGNRVATALESIPDDSGAVPFLSYTTPLSLKLIESRARHKSYASAKDFDMDMARLFEKARRCHDIGSEAYGKVLLLQRLYQALTSAAPPQGPPYSSTTNFAALPAGPASAGLPDELAPAQGVSPAAKALVEEVRYKGLTVRVGDWVHLANPDDPSRPIAGQVFACWASQDAATIGQYGVNVCWYYRPEQTFHPSSRTFMDHEIFKTTRLVDHPQEDILEKVACQPLALFARGRPRAPWWYPGFPLYVCSNRYRERERGFLRIRNWDVIPPPLGGVEGKPVMTSLHAPIYEFERRVNPRRISSPFIAGRDGKGKGAIAIQGPGGLIEEGAAGANGASAVETPVPSRKRARRGEAGDVASKAASPAPTALAATLAGYQYQGTTLTQQQLLALSMQAQVQAQAQIQRPDRSVVTAAGGVAGGAQVEPLPAETAKHFDRDPETNEMLWFAAPPLDISRVPSTPKHSLEYLHFLAMKRKNATAEHMDVDGETGDRDKSKRPRTAMPTVGEAMAAALRNAIAS